MNGCLGVHVICLAITKQSTIACDLHILPRWITLAFPLGSVNARSAYLSAMSGENLHCATATASSVNNQATVHACSVQTTTGSTSVSWALCELSHVD